MCLSLLFFTLFSCKNESGRQLEVPEKLTEIDNNVLGQSLQICSTAPLTGFFRNGYCLTGPTNPARHVICAEMTVEFLEFSKKMGNDLTSPYPPNNFPGLKAGDRWCLAVHRWEEAYEAGLAPPVVFEATNQLVFRNLEASILEENGKEKSK
jgi:hypothetical protein